MLNKWLATHINNLLLLFGLLLALLISNFGYADLYRNVLELTALGLSFHHWVNDAFMAIYFLLIGIEVKREIKIGKLSSLKQASFPVICALGGMMVPALIYYFLNKNSSGAAGWAIPTATDIAFALAALAIVKTLVPPILTLLMTSIAIADDIGAILLIAIFYSKDLVWQFAMGAFVLLSILWLLKKYIHVPLKIYALFGLFVWLCIYSSGVHATIAGVLMAMVLPVDLGKTVETRLSPFVYLFVLPLFAFSNAGVVLSGAQIWDSVGIGIILGLVLGKQIGIFSFAWLSVKMGLALKPKEIRWTHLYGISCLCGIGFTMSLFIGHLAFGNSPPMETTKVAVMIASSAAAILGLIVLRSTGKKINVNL
jgi:Na+:H+ antiporter, NhaA family